MYFINKYFEKFATTKNQGAPENFTIGLCKCIHVAPSSNCSLLTLNPSFKVILRRFEVVL